MRCTHTHTLTLQLLHTCTRTVRRGSSLLQTQSLFFLLAALDVARSDLGVLGDICCRAPWCVCACEFVCVCVSVCTRAHECMLECACECVQCENKKRVGRGGASGRREDFIKSMHLRVCGGEQRRVEGASSQATGHACNRRIQKPGTKPCAHGMRWQPTGDPYALCTPLGTRSCPQRRMRTRIHTQGCAPTQDALART